MSASRASIAVRGIPDPVESHHLATTAQPPTMKPESANSGAEVGYEGHLWRETDAKHDSVGVVEFKRGLSRWAGGKRWKDDASASEVRNRDSVRLSLGFRQ